MISAGNTVGIAAACPNYHKTRYGANRDRILAVGRARAAERRALFPPRKPGGILGQERASTPRATTKPTTRHLEWAAGFLEGEGYFGRHAHAPASGRVSAAQVQREPLDRIARYFGGSIYHKAARSLQHHDTFYWQVDGPRARGVMMTLYALLSPKRQAEIRRALGHPDG